MAKKEKYQLEIYVRSSQSILFNFLSQPESMTEWFADKVNLKDDMYVFEWDGSEESAYLLDYNPDESIRWQWEYDEGTDYYFEFKIQIDDLTKDMALIVTDFAESDEVDENKRLWLSQFDRLLHILGN